MGIFNQIWEHLLESVRVPPEYEEIDVSKGNLSIEEVRAIALKVKEKEGWHLLDRLVINLCKKTENGKLVWMVGFYLEDVQEPYIGYQAAIQIDDETGEMIGKGFALR